MPTPIPPDRLPRLREALDRYGPDDKESQQRLADIYGVALSRMVTLIKNRFKGFPPHERHGDKTHWYPARPAIQCMIDYTAGRGALNRESAARAAAALTGQEVPAGETQAPAQAEACQRCSGLLTPVELDRLASAQTRIWRLRREQGNYVLRTEVEDMARRFYSLVTQRIMNIPNIVDANGRLPPAERAALQRECRDINLAIHKEVEGLLTDVDELSGGDADASGGIERHSPRRRGRSGSADMAAAT